jgi:cell pole-organizing protein PopZ
MLKAWLDENLPEIVREQVEEEVRRIARGRVR